MAWAASSAARDTKYQEGDTNTFQMAASEVIKKGDQVRIIASGYAAAGTTAVFAGDQFVGIAMESKTNTSTAGEKSILCCTKYGSVHSFKHAAASQSLVGTLAYGDVDNGPQYAAATGTSAVQIGSVVEYVSATEVRVQIKPGTAVAT